MRTTTTVPLHAPGAIGVQHHLTFYKYSPTNNSDEVHPRAYIQASLHADELPGLLVSHHLIRLLDAAAKEGRIAKEIVIAPYANPIGLSQNMLGNHIGRYSLMSGVNFNRDWIDIGKSVIERVKEEGIDQLDPSDNAKNVQVFRKAMMREIDALESNPSSKLEVTMKRELFKQV